MAANRSRGYLTLISIFVVYMFYLQNSINILEPSLERQTDFVPINDFKDQQGCSYSSEGGIGMQYTVVGTGQLFGQCRRKSERDKLDNQRRPFLKIERRQYFKSFLRKKINNQLIFRTEF